MPRIVATLKAPMAMNSSVISRNATRSLRCTGARTRATQLTSAPMGERSRKAASGSVRSSRMEARAEYTPSRLRNPARILVADDTPANVRMLETRLSRDGYEVLVARDGEEALAIAREAQPDLILLDIMMPKLAGLEVCRRLKRDA